MSVSSLNVPKVVSLPVKEVDSHASALQDLKDVCKHYFEEIKEESAMEHVTVERLGRLAGIALEIIDHFEQYGK